MKNVLIILFALGILNTNAQTVFNTKQDVLNFLNNKQFSNYNADGTVIRTFTFYDSAWKAKDKNSSTILNVSTITPCGNFAAVEYYDHDPRLSVTFFIYGNNTLELHDVNLPEYDPRKVNGAIYKLDVPENKEVNYSEKFSKDIWEKKSVTKFQMYNPKSFSWEGIIFTEPGKYIEIRNGKDLRITDIDILQYLVDGPVAGLYKSGQFINGVSEPAKTELTTRFNGDFVLYDNNGLESKWDKTTIFFYYDRSNKNTALEYQSFICKCKARIFFDDYGKGFQTY